MENWTDDPKELLEDAQDTLKKRKSELEEAQVWYREYASKVDWLEGEVESAQDEVERLTAEVEESNE